MLLKHEISLQTVVLVRFSLPLPFFYTYRIFPLLDFVLFQMVSASKFPSTVAETQISLLFCIEMIPLGITNRRMSPKRYIEFVQLLSSESNDICSKEGKKLISPEHIIKALEVRNKNNNPPNFFVTFS